MIMKVIMMMRVRMKVIASRYGRVLPIVSTK